MHSGVTNYTMRNSIFFIFMLLVFANLKAQKSQFEIQHFDKLKPGPVKVFSKNRLLGTTDSLGYLQLNEVEWFVDIQLEQNGLKLNYELLDTTNTFVFYAGGKGKSYIVKIVPETTEEAVVRAIRAAEKEPHSKSEISKAALEVQNLGRDLPVMLQYQPSVVTTSDAGNGVGYTGIRVRGSDASRTNITINGVPINDAESQGTFWVNMPDLASSVQSIQLQRGVGSSTNGAGAFGATVNIQTATSFKPFGLISQSYGSYDTRKTTIAAGTGLLNKHWTLDLRLSQIHSNGFIDRGASDLNSWFVSGGYFARKWSLKMLVFNGAEHTYQVWYGIPREKMFGNDSALRAHYDRNKGTVYKSVADSMNLFTSNKRSYNYFNYENESDRYSQTHYHLYFNTQINRRHSLNATLYKTLGGGYFEQFRFMDPLSSYNLPPVIFGTDTIRNSDIIRRRWLDIH
jgi:iron complex outermembrane recepter protein